MSNYHFNHRTLKFPNARLLVHNQLRCGRAASEAIAHSACEFGLLSQEERDEVLQTQFNHPCLCLATAKHVVHKYCDSKNVGPNAAGLDAVHLWKIIEEDVQAYNDKEFEQSATDDSTKSNPPKQHQCSKLAPVVFDLLLQELLRHPD